MKVLFLIVISLSLSIPTLAQDVDKPTAIDSYPLPAQPGAVRYTLADRWDTTSLAFVFKNCPTTVACDRGQNAVRAAFDSWANVSVLTFTEVNNTGAADIEIQWTTAEEGFGAPGGTLAFAFFPSFGGDMFFDDAEPWTLRDGGDTDLFVVAQHEIGHAIGLDHTDDVNAVMYAFSGAASDLAADDVAGIQRLYGADGGESPAPEPDLPDEVPSGPVETVEGMIDNSNFYEMWTIDVDAGETVTFSMQALTGDLDAYLAIFTPDMEEVLTEDDDSMGGTDSQLTFTFQAADDYVIIATRYDTNEGDTSGNYRLTAERLGVESAPGVPIIPNDVADLTITNFSGTTLCGIAGGKVMGITLGTLDDDPDVQISYHLFVGSKASWDVIGGTAPQFDTWPHVANDAGDQDDG